MKILLIICISTLCCFGLLKDDTINGIDPMQYPKGYPNSPQSVIQQLSTYPLPRYLASNKLLHLFNWMNPLYMGGRGQKGISEISATYSSVEIQKELITNWNYGVVLNNAGYMMSGPMVKGCPITIQLANEHPEIPLHVITFWMQVRPKKAGYTNPKPMILSKNLDSALYIDFDFYGKQKREINFTFPDSLIQIDGRTQKHHLTEIIKCLTRPIELINENGEEPPGPYLIDAIQKDPVLIELKKNMKTDSWKDFMATRKLQMRNAYSSSFMKEIPELKNTKFNFYANEGGPVNCFEWSIMKKCMTPINGNYYSTPDFYPRWPNNWKDWQGPWHGWKWIETGREKEIKDGDNLFSPFVAAGWSKKQEEDIQPGQWLGLLKCLAGVGAEFYYVGYFSLSKPFTDPSKWVWQAAMPAYAQAITSRFEDVLKEGNVLFDTDKNPVITYKTNDKHVLITVRKHNLKEKYIICGTYQPFSNDKNALPEKKNINVIIAGQDFSFEIRRQGSVYVYEKTDDGKILFYQLDKWHENSHPDHWSKDFYFEAEVSDSTISNNILFTNNEKNNLDFTNYVTYVTLKKNTSTSYNYTVRDSSTHLKYAWLYYRGAGTLSVAFKKANEKANMQEEKLSKTDQWKWHKIKIPESNYTAQEVKFLLKGVNGTINIDKLIISSKDTSP